MKVVAFRSDGEKVIEAILQEDRGVFLTWWGGYGLEALAPTFSLEALLRQPDWKEADLVLPKNFEEGRLEEHAGTLTFIAGN